MHFINPIRKFYEVVWCRYGKSSNERAII